MMLMAQAADLIIVFLALGTALHPALRAGGLCPAAGRNPKKPGLNTFLLGAFATGFVVYGIALVFGATGTTSLSGIVLVG